ncbi:MAG: hypothetical protein N2C12_06040 [Planctomycetales bacterium]
MISRKKLTPDKQGYYYRNLGWKKTKCGNGLSQAKFILGKDEQQCDVPQIKYAVEIYS